MTAVLTPLYRWLGAVSETFPEHGAPAHADVVPPDLLGFGKQRRRALSDHGDPSIDDANLDLDLNIVVDADYLQAATRRY